nr:sulfatase [Candidatus Sigynarchaeota archaeon]
MDRYTPAMRPNIVFMITHDTGTRLGCYGGGGVTPQIDALAAQGVRLVNYFASAPQCSPSRGSILTGKAPHANGLMGLTNMGWDLPASNRTLPSLLNEAGYTTRLIGHQHVHRDRTVIGYAETSNPIREAPFFARIVCKSGEKFFKRVARGDVQQPFYLELGFTETHRPFITGRQRRPRQGDVTVPPYLPHTVAVRDDIARFDGMLAEVDHHVGQLLEALEKQDLARNTLVIFTTDHGWPFPRAKGTLYDAGIRSACVMRWPGKIPAGQSVDALLSNVDLMPTLLDVAGARLDGEGIAGIQGRSFKGLLTGDSYTPRECIHAELTYHDQGYNPMRCIRTARWKYIHNFNTIGDQLFQIPNDFRDGPSGKAYRDAHPEYHHPRPLEELYDLEVDPGERDNLASKPAYSTTKKELHEKLFSYLIETADPVLSGHVPAPEKKGPMLM